jgi:hypothetical protein
MSRSDAYLFYEAGQAVAAAHLGLQIRHISGNPGVIASEIQLPRRNPKARMVLWLTGMAAEKKGVGRSDPLRRTRNRQRVRSQMEALMGELEGSPARRKAEAHNLFSQSQDQANAICSALYEAIERLTQRLRECPKVSGQEVAAIVAAAKVRRPEKREV